MKISATVVTGFLGAGKTTLIRHLLENAGGRRIAVIINEFGDIGIDRDILMGCGIPDCEDSVIELANGCICCTVADAFLPTMEQLLNHPRPPEHIVIETSGLALPKPLVQAFNWPAVKARVTVDGVIVVADAPHVADGLSTIPVVPEDPASAHPTPIEELFADQLACADLVLLNKADQLEAEALEGLRDRLKQAVPVGTRIVSTSFGRLDPIVALGIDARSEDAIDGRRCFHDEDEDDHDHDEFISFVVPIADISDPEALVNRLRDIARRHDVLRMKGFIAVDGKPRRLVVQAVGPRVQHYFDRPWQAEEPRLGSLVVIAETGVDQAQVTAELEAIRETA